jgi:hypothetical protein
MIAYIMTKSQCGIVQSLTREWDLKFIHVAAAPVLNSHENVLTPAFTVTLVLTLSQLKGVIRLKSLLHIVIETVHKFKINCRMTPGAFMRDFMMLLTEKLNLVHHYYHWGQFR